MDCSVGWTHSATGEWLAPVRTRRDLTRLIFRHTELQELSVQVRYLWRDAGGAKEANLFADVTVGR